MKHINPSARSQTHYSGGDYIIRQGATGDTFFIISEGQVRKRDERGCTRPECDLGGHTGGLAC